MRWLVAIVSTASVVFSLINQTIMIEIISGSPYNKISDKITKKIALSKLPLYGEKEIIKLSAELYGKVKIKLDVEDNIEVISQIRGYEHAKNATRIGYFTYKWEADPSALPKEYERYIKPEIESFIKLLSIFSNANEWILRFSVVGGGYKVNERPGHKMATQFAIIDLFKQV